MELQEAAGELQEGEAERRSYPGGAAARALEEHSGALAPKSLWPVGEASGRPRPRARPVRAAGASQAAAPLRRPAPSHAREGGEEEGEGEEKEEEGEGDQEEEEKEGEEG